MTTITRVHRRFILGALLVSSAAAADAPFDFATAPGRLPKIVVPQSYRIAIVPNVDAASLQGQETVELRVTHPTATIQFNSLNETLRAVRFDGKPVKGVVSDDDQQLTTVTLAAPAAVGLHRLTFAYQGKIESAPHGLFAQKYIGPDGKPGVLLSTQMEATDARRMFPCWDEPSFRAVFQLSVTVPRDWAAISNMRPAHRTEHAETATVDFEPSPKMPSYLVEFTGGHMTRITGAGPGNTEIGVWAVTGRERDGATALANAQQILADYNTYFGYAFPLPKLDSIAIPGGFSGAMENWGAITYNDQVLLVQPSSSLSDKQTVYSIQAHEMAHQWFGDLVTMGWWDDIWLNESFASWRAAKQTDLRNPTWKWWELEDATKERAMQADARPSSHAIEQHVVNELQAENSFDSEITYNKGQSILRMLEAYLGEDVFRDGIRGYMRARAFSNATSADLWSALSAAGGKDVGRIARLWTENPGFPLVSVASSCDASGARDITVTQHRFLLTGADAAPSQWQIPLNVRTSATGAPMTTLLERNGQTLPAGHCGDPLSVNADAIGYFRVAYDQPTLAANTRHFDSIPDADRIGMLDDQWALVETGVAPLDTYLALAGSMGGDTDSRAWEQILTALGTIEYDERGTLGHEPFVAYARSLIKPLADKLGWDPRADETPAVTGLRRTLLTDLGAWGDPAIIAEAQRRFAAFVKDRSALRPDEQATVLSIVAENADAGTFAQLHAVAKQAKDDTELNRYYGAMATVRDPELARQVAQIALSDEMPPQVPVLRLRMIVGLSAHNNKLSWDTFTANEEKLVAAVPFQAPLIVAQYLPSFYWDAVPLDQLESWIRGHVPAEMSPAVARGMETARFKLKEKQSLVPAADAFVVARRHLARAG